MWRQTFVRFVADIKTQSKWYFTAYAHRNTHSNIWP